MPAYQAYPPSGAREPKPLPKFFKLSVTVMRFRYFQLLYTKWRGTRMRRIKRACEIRISTPLINRVKKQSAVLQCVTRTLAVWRGATRKLGTGAAKLGAQAESAIAG